MTSSEPLLRLAAVTKSYAASEPVLRGVDLDLGRGDSLAVLGPSGSGKSTLLAIAGTLDRPDAGQVTFEGRDLLALAGDELAAFRNHELGFVFQQHLLLPQLSALENVLLPLLADGRASAADEARARGLLERVGLAERASHRPAELSGGERQRVAVVRALIRSPRLVLADEPTGSLDAESADVLADLLIEVVERESVALLVVTHSESLARRVGRRVQLELGRLTESA